VSNPVTRNFGTARGLVRLGLSYVEAVPIWSAAVEPVPGEVQRLVFVCHGNICRSAFAEGVARDLGLSTASFGLSTSTGKAAHGPAKEAAKALGHPIEEHSTTRVQDFVPLRGDYLLGMEHRHLRKLAAIETLAHLPRGLLGRYACPPMPHLHDPYLLDPAFMEVCLRRVETAVQALARRYPRATLS
jgi:protein-tyrosine phosphatase